MTIFLIAIYVIVLVVITIYSFRKNETSKSFLVANRSLSTLQVAASATVGVIDSTAVLIMFGSVLLFGPGGIGIWVGYFFATICIALLTPHFYTIVQKQNIQTISEFFQIRFGPYTEKVFLCISTLFSVGLIVGIYSINLVLFKEFFELGVLSATLISFIVTLSYISLGGFRALVRTDVLQFLIMFCLLVAAVIFFPGSERIPFDTPSSWFTGAFTMIAPVIFFQNMIKPAAWLPVLGAKSTSVAKQGMWLAVLLNILIIAPIVYISFAYAQILPNSLPDRVLLDALGVALPDFMTPLVFIALFAALMSSLDSILFFVATNLARFGVTSNFVNSKQELSVIRYLIIIVSLVTSLLATLVPDFVTFGFAIVPLIGIMAIPFLAAFFSEFIHLDRHVALASIIGTISFGYLFLNPPENYLINIIPILITGSLFGIFVLFKKRN